MLRFGEPGVLWGLLAIPALAFLWLWADRRRRRDLDRWIGRELWPRLIADRSEAVRTASAALLLLSLFLLLLGAARPQLGSRVLETRQRGIDVVLAVDVSLSMEARDIAPSREERARQEVLALLDRLKGDRIALVTFAGEAFLQSPLTLDRGTVRMLLPLLDPESAVEPGTNLAEAVLRSAGAFQEDPRRGRAVILLTDGEAHQGDIDAAIAAAKEARVRICAIGIGKAQGEPIPLATRPGAPPEYKRDSNGQIVMTRLTEEPLRRLCSETGGAYVRSDAGSAGARVIEALRDLQQGETKGGLGIRYKERFAYFAGASFTLLLVEGLLGEKRRRSERREQG